MGTEGQLRVPDGRAERELAGRREGLDPRLVLPRGLGDIMLSDVGQTEENHGGIPLHEVPRAVTATGTEGRCWYQGPGV